MCKLIYVKTWARFSAQLHFELPLLHALSFTSSQLKSMSSSSKEADSVDSHSLMFVRCLRDFLMRIAPKALWWAFYLYSQVAQNSAKRDLSISLCVTIAMILQDSEPALSIFDVEKRISLYLARTSPQQTIDHLLYEITQLIEADDEPVTAHKPASLVVSSLTTSSNQQRSYVYLAFAFRNLSIFLLQPAL